MNIHSKILVHWTGKDIENRPDIEKAQLYVKRLTDYYKNGLYAKRTDEDTIRGRKIINIVRLCFTEIRFSQVQTHADRYGKLGIGFTRDFIINKGGRPVIYIPFEPPPEGRLLEDSIRNAYKISGDNQGMRESLKWITAHVKRMTNEDKEDYYEESEWRIVFDESPKNRHFTESGTAGIYRLLFEASDIKIIVFPDEYIRQKSLKNEIIKKFFSKHMPLMATLDDCRNF